MIDDFLFIFGVHSIFMNFMCSYGLHSALILGAMEDWASPTYL